jgi:hypothetical protein
VIACILETQPLIVGTDVGIAVIGASDGSALGIKVGAEVRKTTHQKRSWSISMRFRQENMNKDPLQPMIMTKTNL